MDKISINDLGTDLQVTITENDAVVDISNATTFEIILIKPNGAEVTKTATRLTDGTDGVIRYQTVSGDIDQLDVWEYKGRVTFSPTQVYNSIDPQKFEVL